MQLLYIRNCILTQPEVTRSYVFNLGCYFLSMNVDNNAFENECLPKEANLYINVEAGPGGDCKQL